jgi:mono/diheme cytochrome c family protein
MGAGYALAQPDAVSEGRCDYKRLMLQIVNFIIFEFSKADCRKRARRVDFRTAGRHPRLAIWTAAFCALVFSAEAWSAGPPGGSHFRNRGAGSSQSGVAFDGFGAPLPAIANSPADLANFNNGLMNFQEVETLNPANAPSGPAGQLGPLFNNTSCAACHSNPARGGGGLTLMEQRLSTGGPPVRIFAVDHMLFGGPLAQGKLGQIFEFGQIAPPLGSEIGHPRQYTFGLPAGRDGQRLFACPSDLRGRKFE